MKQEIIDQLDKIGTTYDCKLLLPPFNGSNNPFYFIGDIKNDAIIFHDFFIALDKIDVSFRYVSIDNKLNYIEVLNDRI